MGATLSYLPHGTVQVGTDAVIEHINNLSKMVVPVGQRSTEAIKRDIPKLNVRMPLIDVMEEFIGLQHEYQRTMQSSSTFEVSDRVDMLKLMKNWWSNQWEDELENAVDWQGVIFPGKTPIIAQRPSKKFKKGWKHFKEDNVTRKAYIETMKQFGNDVTETGDEDESGDENDSDSDNDDNDENNESEEEKEEEDSEEEVEPDDEYEEEELS